MDVSVPKPEYSAPRDAGGQGLEVEDCQGLPQEELALQPSEGEQVPNLPPHSHPDRASDPPPDLVIQLLICFLIQFLIRQLIQLLIRLLVK